MYLFNFFVKNCSCLGQKRHGIISTHFLMLPVKIVINSKLLHILSVQLSCSVASNSATPWTAPHQTSLAITSSRSLLKLNVHQVGDAIKPYKYIIDSPKSSARVIQGQNCKFIYLLLLVVLCLCCCMWAFSNCSKPGLLFFLL